MITGVTYLSIHKWYTITIQYYLTIKDIQNANYSNLKAFINKKKLFQNFPNYILSLNFLTCTIAAQCTYKQFSVGEDKNTWRFLHSEFNPGF